MAILLVKHVTKPGIKVQKSTCAGDQQCWSNILMLYTKGFIIRKELIFGCLFARPYLLHVQLIFE